MTTLTETLDAFAREMRAKMPAPVLTTMDRVTQELEASGQVQRSIQSGETAPDFSLPDHQGNTVSLREKLQHGPVILSFYRGGWCPYCNLELKALQQHLPEITRLGAKLLAISPELPDLGMETRRSNELEFEVLSDTDNHVARSFGLLFALPEDLQAIYQGFGIDLVKRNGNSSYELPFPGTFVIQPDSTISLAFVATDYTRRLEPGDIIKHLER